MENYKKMNDNVNDVFRMNESNEWKTNTNNLSIREIIL